MTGTLRKPPFQQWADALNGLTFRLDGQSLELLGERSQGFHVHGLEERMMEPPAATDQGTFEGLLKVPFPYPQTVLAPFINPVFWGNFCSIHTSGSQIYGCEGDYGWKGYTEEQFSLGSEHCSLTIQNLLNIDYDYPLGGEAFARASYDLRKAISGGMTQNHGYMRTLPRSSNGAWLEGKKIFGFAPDSEVGKVIYRLPKKLVEVLLTTYLLANLLAYTFKVAQRLGESGPGLSEDALDGYFDALVEVGFDPTAGTLARVPAG
jgi:hypothetical protein